MPYVFERIWQSRRESLRKRGDGVNAITTEANRVVEWTLTSKSEYGDPDRQVTLQAIFTCPAGRVLRVPAFWAGGNSWKLRYSSFRPGDHAFHTECSDLRNTDLHGVEGRLVVTGYRGANALLRHGPIRVAEDKRHFEHLDKTPFLWLGDTWWMGLCERLDMAGFRELTADRAQKGFNVVQIVAGLYPDMPAFDARGRGEGGFPWQEGYRALRSEYFDAAEKRIAHLVESGIVPCIVGAWGYHLPWLGIPKMKQHWRNLVARFAAYPVVWCVAGEATMPYYLSETKEKDAEFQKRGWTEIAAYVRSIDPFGRMVTLHPGDSSRNVVDDTSVLDFDMLQTGHDDRRCIANTVELLRASRSATPTIPVIDGEVCYEGILDSCWADVQRFMVWTCLLSGAAGHTYGANGIWQVNGDTEAYGPSPHGGNWGNRPWRQAAALPGSTQVGLAKRLLERFEWWRFEPHPEWAEYADPGDPPSRYEVPFAGGIPLEARVVYVPARRPVALRALEPGVEYEASGFDPATGVDIPMRMSGDGVFSAPTGIEGDWVLTQRALN